MVDCSSGYRWIVVSTFLCGGCGGAASDSQAEMTQAQRDAVADSVLQYSSEVMAAGERLDVDELAGWLRDGPGAAFGGASGIMLSTDEFRSNVQVAYSNLTAQQFAMTGERVVVLGPDAAVVMGLGGFATTDTLGNRGYGNQAFTFVWARADGEWRIVQAHFSSNLLRLEPPGDSTPP